MRTGSALIAFGEANVTGFPAVGTIVKSIDAQAHAQLRLAEAAVFLAGTLRLGTITLGTKSHWHHNAPFDDLVTSYHSRTPVARLTSRSTARLVLGQTALSRADLAARPGTTNTRLQKGTFLTS